MPSFSWSHTRGHPGFGQAGARGRGGPFPQAGFIQHETRDPGPKSIAHQAISFRMASISARLPGFGDAEKDRCPQADTVSESSMPNMTPFSSSRRFQLGVEASRGLHDELVKGRTSIDGAEARAARPAEIFGLVAVELRHMAQARSAHAGQIHGAGHGAQTRIGADVGHGLFAADVLLAGGQGEHEGALARVVHRIAHQTARQVARMKLLRVAMSEVGAAERLGQAEALAFAADDVRALAARAGEEAVGHRLGEAGNEQPLAGVDPFRLFGEALDDAEDVGRLYDERGEALFVPEVLKARAGPRPSWSGRGPRCRWRCSRCRAPVPVMRVQGQRHGHGVALGQAAGHQRAFGQRGRAVVHGSVGHFHAQQPGDEGLELEDALQRCPG